MYRGGVSRIECSGNGQEHITRKPRANFRVAKRRRKKKEEKSFWSHTLAQCKKWTETKGEMKELTLRVGVGRNRGRTSPTPEETRRSDLEVGIASREKKHKKTPTPERVQKVRHEKSTIQPY